ncbi:hypothetical protein LSH36_586g01019 [Paralvinella palmiformis]|uniref:TLC domain-containing protein n=1 Tax=Paralvinella palmiformis TaxID=53620 RepID=A0AAD9MV99_9ANNE|nr:hypothetical protein LSH36_586g01019 [Paralvinella palmiformis]
MAVALVVRLVDIFWTDSFWLPSNHTWSEIIAKRESGEMYLSLPRDLWAPFPIAVILLLVRLLWERLIALPVGRCFNIKETRCTQPVRNDILERAFKKYGKHQPDHDVLVGIAKQADWSLRSVERWWRRQRSWNKPPDMQKFQETSWRFLFYIVAFWTGLTVVYQKDYFWDTHHCWYNYPWHPIPGEIYWYYMVELGFYWSLVFSLFMDVKRKDFVEMIIHHVVTIALLSFAWAGGMGAKMAKYCKYHKLCDVLFIIFAVVWFITRLVIYPLSSIRSSRGIRGTDECIQRQQHTRMPVHTRRRRLQPLTY